MSAELRSLESDRFGLDCHQVQTGQQVPERLQMTEMLPKLSSETVSHDGVADAATHRKRDKRAIGSARRETHPDGAASTNITVGPELRELRTGTYGAQHPRSGAEAVPALGAACTKDGAPGAIRHAMAEPVLLRPATVVRLKGAFHGMPSSSEHPATVLSSLGEPMRCRVGHEHTGGGSAQTCRG